MVPRIRELLNIALDFQGLQRHDFGQDTYALTIGDINNDGRTDLIGAGENTDYMCSWLVELMIPIADFDRTMARLAVTELEDN